MFERDWRNFFRPDDCVRVHKTSDVYITREYANALLREQLGKCQRVLFNAHGETHKRPTHWGRLASGFRNCCPGTLREHSRDGVPVPAPPNRTGMEFSWVAKSA